MKNTEMIRFLPDQLKSKKMCKHAVKQSRLFPDMFLMDIRLNKCVVKLLIFIFLEHNSLLNVNKCAIKLLSFSEF